MNKQDVDRFEKIQTQLHGLHMEISTLSKKSQNDALNKFKLKFVNQLISAANELLNDDDKPFKDFSLFDEDDIPTNSDVVMMLTQYLNCLEKLRTDNIMQEDESPWYWYWVTEGKISDIRTVAPQKNKEK